MQGLQQPTETERRSAATPGSSGAGPGRASVRESAMSGVHHCLRRHAHAGMLARGRLRRYTAGISVAPLGQDCGNYRATVSRKTALRLAPTFGNMGEPTQRFGAVGQEETLG